MDHNETKPEQNENSENVPAVASAFSTSRRVVTAVLVLVAALLLGYVLYDILLSHPTETQVDEQPAAVNESPVVVDEESTEYSDAEKTAILEAMNEAGGEASVVEAEERRAVLQAMDTESDNETSAEDKAAVLNAMQ
jgi:hypothetical protein